MVNEFHTEDITLAIKPIKAKQTYNIRNLVLRPGCPIQSCIWEGDTETSSFHLGAYYNTQLVAVCTYLKKNHNSFQELLQYQLRGMAVLEGYRGLHIGNKLLHYGEHLLLQKQVALLWCNTRENAVAFYHKNDFKITGELFHIPNIGSHYLMKKKLCK